MIVGNLVFKTKAELRKYVATLIAPMIGQSLSSGGDFDFLKELLRMHPDYVGSSPQLFLVQRNAFGQPELAAMIDGTKYVFSYNTCIRGKLKPDGDKLTKAMRTAIVNQILDVPKAQDCELCLKPLVDGEVTHVDHVVLFKDLKTEFLKVWGKEPPKEFDEDPNIGGRIRFKSCDAEFSVEWQKYHYDKSVLRVVHAGCNLRRKRLYNLPA